MRNSMVVAEVESHNRAVDDFPILFVIVAHDGLVVDHPCVRAWQI